MLMKNEYFTFKNVFLTSNDHFRKKLTVFVTLTTSSDSKMNQIIPV